MTNISAAEAFQLYKQDKVIAALARRYGAGFYRFLENFNVADGTLSVTVADTVAGTNATAFTVGIASGTTPRISIAENTGKTGDYILTIKPGTLVASRTVLFPDSIGANDVIVTEALAQTLTNKTLTTPTLTVPVIASFASAQHNHSNAAGGGTISVPDSLTGTSATTFTIGVGGTIPKAAISVLGSTGNYTATLQIPVLAASRTITFPAVTCTLASITGTETLTNKTLTSPVIGTGLTASGSAANTFAGSTGTFLTSTGAVTIGPGAVGVTGAVTMATTMGITFGDAAAGTATPITAYSLTANLGAIILTVTDSITNHATTITNSALNGSAATITLPSATCTLPGIGLANTFTAAQTVAIDDAGNTSITDVLSLKHTTSGSSGAGIGAGISITIENDTDATTENASIDWIETSDGTKASLDTDIHFKTMLGGGLSTAILVDASAQEVQIGASASDGDGLNTLRIFPHTTAARGSLVFTSSINGTGDFATTVTQATTVSEAQTITIPDSDASTDTFSLLGTAQTFSAIKTFSAAPVVSINAAAGVTTVATIGKTNSGGAGADNDGLKLSFIVENATDATTEVASIQLLSTTAAKATNDTDVIISTMLGGAVTAAITVDASAQQVVFGVNGTDVDGINAIRIYPLTAASGSLIVQAAVDASGDHATTVTNAVDAAAAATVTLPSGSAKLAGIVTQTATTHTGTGAVPITHGMVACTTGGPGEAWTLADGFPGQIIHIRLATDGGGDGTLTPATKLGYTNIVFADAGDAVTLQFVVTLGWIILGAYGYAAPPVIA